MNVFVTVVVWIAGRMPIFAQSPVTEEAFNMGFGLLPGIVVGQYLFKAGIALADTPVFYVGTTVLRRWIDAEPQSVATAS